MAGSTPHLIRSVACAGLVAGLAFMAAPPASAQDANDPPPATAAEIAEARALADEVIARADAEGLFINITDDGVPRVRHLASGMVCSFSGTQWDGITVFPTRDGMRRGEDVSCGSRMGEVFLTTYATRYANRLTEEQALLSALASIRHRYPDAREYEGPISIMARDGMNEPLAIGALVKIDGVENLALVFVSHMGEWSFKQRATGPGDYSLVNLLGAFSFVMALPDPS